MFDFLMQRGRARPWLLLAPLLIVAAWLLRVAMAALPPEQGPGGPILVVTSASSTYGKYYAEILRTEGFNAFAVADISAVTPGMLASYDVVVLAKMPVSGTLATTFSDWVSGGGTLIAMAPDPKLSNLLGIAATGGSLAEGYLRVDTATVPGNGIVGQTMQFHGSANLYTLNGASSVATLYADAATPTTSPAVTMRAVGSGNAAAFAYDLATSVVYTRQGNPAWAAQERDGFTPIRSDDKFFGNATGDPEPDFVDLAKVAIPQADEQQRLLANLIVTLGASRKPLPRFWYFPNGKKAVVVMTGDDHANGGTAGRFDEFNAASPPGCSVANWECVRSTSYVYPGTPLTDAQAASYTAQGFEVSLHINTDCLDFTAASLESTYVQQLGSWLAQFPSIAAPATQRHHCIVWSDWLTAAKTEINHGMRLDASYYFWPPSWINDTPGLFTGSAMPMRLVDLDGSFVDVYEATTQMTDESGQSYPFTIDTLLDRALGAEGYFGAYTVNAHTDLAYSPVADAVLNSALARAVPIVSSRQMLNWLDARNNSSFGSITWSGSALTFTIARDPAAVGLMAMLPARSPTGTLRTLTRDGASVAFSIATIKGLQYVTFPAPSGAYAATYAADSIPPTVTAKTPQDGATGISTNVKVTATFSEAIDPATISASTFELRDPGGNIVLATIGYDAPTLTATLAATNALLANTTYGVRLHGGATDPRVKDLAGNALAADVTWSFTTGNGDNCPCSAWTDSAAPANPSSSDTSSVEVGVKFVVDVPGTITGLRFYKGNGNTGTHIGNLWTSSGQLLATVTFTAETVSGWQEAAFATPVAIAADTVYVASYFAPAGQYAFDANFFANAGVDRPPLHLLQNGVGGGNGVYTYGSSSAFPASTFQASNYWVDVVFAEGSAPDTTPPTVTSTTPASGATGVAVTSTVRATFSEAIDPTTITGTTFQLRDAGNSLVAASVAYDSPSRTATLTPAVSLAASANYSATLVGGATDPRVKDVAGNALAQSVAWSFTTGATGICASPPNPIVAENCQPGNDAAEWDVSGAGDPSLQGFATDISVNLGSIVTFKVKTDATSYRLDIYRMGYYGGKGARKIATVQPSASLPQTQPACLTDATTKLVDCGNWAASAQWSVPSNATSGIYFARLVRPDSGGASHVFFIVRDDSSHSDVLFQTSDTTWQAYNDYGGASLYGGNGVQFDQNNRGYKVSYNRPFHTREMENGVSWVFNAEYPMVRWLEANGYDVTYATGVDAARFGSLMLNHRIYMPVGHDEYWSGPQRANVEAARNAGVNLAFFTGNGVFWKTRFESSIDASSTPFRTLVSYKETHANAVIDPQDPPTWSGTWRDPRFSPPGDGGRPENALMGTIFMVNGPRVPPDALQVPDADGKMRFWRNTSIATLPAGQTATLPAGTLGFEWDVDADNGFRPPGLVRMSTTIVSMSGDYLQDYGSTYAAGTANHALTLYRHASGALVFGAGTIQWSWGLDAIHDHPNYPAPPADVRMQQATVNLLADAGAQPGSLQPGLQAASRSTDGTPPGSTITSPTAGATLSPGVAIVITGTAADTGGGVVGGVEVSVDGGATWHPASGRASWTYSWTPSASGQVTIKSRAVDDSGNLETPGSGVTVTVGNGGGGPTILVGNSTINPTIDTNPAGTAEAFQYAATASGTALRLYVYVDASNAATKIAAGIYANSGSDTPGNLLAQATIATPVSGWNSVALPSAAIASGTKYWIAVLGPAGAGTIKFRDRANGGGKAQTSAQTNLSTLPATWSSGTNYVDSPMSAYATQEGADATPPTVTSVSPSANATGVSLTTAVSATFSEAIDPATIGTATFELRDPANNLVSAAVTYNATTLVATLKPSAALAGTTTYTATVKGGTTDPRVKDVAGNALAANRTWSFTTASADTTPPTVTSTTPANGATGVSATANVTAKFSEAMNAARITTGTVVLRDPSNATVAATVSYNASTFVVTLNPTPTLTAGARYTATIVGGASGVTDAAGNPLAADVTWSFTIASDTAPPTVTGVSPVNNATGIGRGTNVKATFSEAMDPATIGSSTFVLSNPANNSVAATITYSGGSATLKPASNLAAGTRYTARVVGGTIGVKDLAGNPLAADFVWSFTTR